MGAALEGGRRLAAEVAGLVRAFRVILAEELFVLLTTAVDSALKRGDGVTTKLAGLIYYY
jgi:hypothetical protein